MRKERVVIERVVIGGWLVNAGVAAVVARGTIKLRNKADRAPSPYPAHYWPSKAQMRAEITADILAKRLLDPSHSQTQEEITAYYRAAAVGDKACVRTDYGGALEFQLLVIAREAIKSRVVTSHSTWYCGRSWYVHGQNYWAPASRARLVIPSPEIEAWIEGGAGLRLGA